MTIAMSPQTAPPTPPVERLITGEELAAMTGLGRCELVEGRIVKMPPPKNKHGRLELRLGRWIGNFVEAHKLGQAMSGEAGVYIRRNPDTVRGMDVAFISNERWAHQPDPDGYLEIAPDLIVEILSPDDRWPAVHRKLREYFSIGVRLVWVVDPDERIIYAHRSLADVRELTEADPLPGDDVLPGLSLAVADLFAE